MLFTATPHDSADIREFCARFNEGLRVEYKQTFDDNVRRALPKVVSSFANSLGGVLIVGVNAHDGVPQNPIEGFVAPPEELPLTVENLCLQGINPPVFPRTTIVQSDVAGRVFLVIEVDESWEAPHAIENSKRVYVRTGNAANPYDLAEVDLVIELVRRRAEPTALRERMLHVAAERARHAFGPDNIHVEVSVCPTYPRRPLCTRDTTWDFFSTQTYRGGRFFSFNTLRRVEDGTASFDPNEYGMLNTYGVLLARKVMRVDNEGFLFIRDPLYLALKLLICAHRFLRMVQYRGDLEVSVILRNVRHQRLLFIPNVILGALDQDDYRCYEDQVEGKQIIAAENIQSNLSITIESIMSQVCWPFWQSPTAFPADRLRNLITDFIQHLGVT